MVFTTKDVNMNNLKGKKLVFNYFDLIGKIRYQQKPFKISYRKIRQTKFKNKTDDILYFGQIYEIGKKKINTHWSHKNI